MTTTDDPVADMATESNAKVFQSSTLDDAYFDRNQVVQLAVMLASMIGYDTWVADDADDLNWVILFIKLPGGQVSWHIPRGEWGAAVVVSRNLEAWDGHDLEEKRARMADILAHGFPRQDRSWR